MPDNNIIQNSTQKLQIPVETQIFNSISELQNLLSSSNVRTEDNRTIIEVYENYLKDLVSKSATEENIAFPIKNFLNHFNIIIIEESLPLQISGKLNNEIITVNSMNVEARQNFTIAHEFAHFALGDTNQTEYRQAYSLYTDAQYDREVLCDSIAAAILMAKVLIDINLSTVLSSLGLGSITDNKARVIYELANKFSVSNQAMINRLNYLGIIKGWVYM